MKIRFFPFAFDRRSFQTQGPLTVCGCPGWVTACSSPESSESDISITLSLCGCIRPMASPWTRMTRFPARRRKVEVVAEAKRIRPKAEFQLEGWYIGPDWFVRSIVREDEVVTYLSLILVIIWLSFGYWLPLSRGIAS